MKRIYALVLMIALLCSVLSAANAGLLDAYNAYINDPANEVPVEEQIEKLEHTVSGIIALEEDDDPENAIDFFMEVLFDEGYGDCPPETLLAALAKISAEAKVDVWSFWADSMIVELSSDIMDGVDRDELYRFAALCDRFVERGLAAIRGGTMTGGYEDRYYFDVCCAMGYGVYTAMVIAGNEYYLAEAALSAGHPELAGVLLASASAAVGRGLWLDDEKAALYMEGTDAMIEDLLWFGDDTVDEREVLEKLREMIEAMMLTM